MIAHLVAGDADDVLHLQCCRLQFVEFLFLFDVHSELTYFYGVRDYFVWIVVEDRPFRDDKVVLEITEV